MHLCGCKRSARRLPTCTHIYVCVHICRHKSTKRLSLKSSAALTFSRRYTYTCTLTYIHTFNTHRYMCTCIYVHMYICTHVYMYIYINTEVNNEAFAGKQRFLDSRARLHMKFHIYIYTYEYAHIYINTHTYSMRVCLYNYTRLNNFTYLHVYVGRQRGIHERAAR